MTLRQTRWMACVSAAFLSSSLLAQAPTPGPPPGPYQPTEVEVKAAFLYHFAQLVTWPESEVEVETASPIVIVIAGRDIFGELLEATIGEETIRGRPLKIQRVPRVRSLSPPPHILFIGSSDPAEVAGILTAMAKAPTLTVSSAKGFAQKGGMIEFRLTPEHRVAFDINVRAVEAAGLKMSSQLLKIARIVEPPQ